MILKDLLKIIEYENKMFLFEKKNKGSILIDVLYIDNKLKRNLKKKFGNFKVLSISVVDNSFIITIQKGE